MGNSDTHWSVSEAKARFSEVLDRARLTPQVIENRGREMVILLDVAEYHALKARSEALAPSTRIAEFLQFCKGMQADVELELPPRPSRPSPFEEEDAF